jgi:N-ethylmaleimide reductase
MNIWTPTKVGNLGIKNRLAMAPMTRSRANPDGTPTPLAAEYYSQRAGLGLLVAEGTQPSAEGQGYIFTPGIYTDAHVEGWKQITSAVHAASSRLFIQLMHVGRVSHPDNTPGHIQAIAPSAVAPKDQMFTLEGMMPIPEPRAMTLADIARTVRDFRNAARRAVDAGADGVEIHGANGYLIHQFFAPNANVRTDAYGGSIENRARFAIEVAKAVAEEIGAERTGIRLSPGATLGGLDEGPAGPDLHRTLVGELNKLGLAYVHIMRLGNDALLADIRKRWDQALIVNRPGRALRDVGSDIAAGLADLESYGQFVLSTPDFAARLKSGAPMNGPDKSTYYGGGAKGYTDYPTLAERAAA